MVHPPSIHGFQNDKENRIQSTKNGEKYGKDSHNGDKKRETNLTVKI